MNNIYKRVLKSKIVSIEIISLATPLSLVFFMSSMFNWGIFFLLVDLSSTTVLAISNNILNRKKKKNEYVHVKFQEKEMKKEVEKEIKSNIVNKMEVTNSYTLPKNKPLTRVLKK